jgi:hypothetical protein
MGHSSQFPTRRLGRGKATSLGVVHYCHRLNARGEDRPAGGQDDAGGIGMRQGETALLVKAALDHHRHARMPEADQAAAGIAAQLVAAREVPFARSGRRLAGSIGAVEGVAPEQLAQK